MRDQESDDSEHAGIHPAVRRQIVDAERLLHRLRAHPGDERALDDEAFSPHLQAACDSSDHGTIALPAALRVHLEPQALRRACDLVLLVREVLQPVDRIGGLDIHHGELHRSPLGLPSHVPLDVRNHALHIEGILRQTGDGQEDDIADVRVDGHDRPIEQRHRIEPQLRPLQEHGRILGIRVPDRFFLPRLLPEARLVVYRREAEVGVGDLRRFQLGETALREERVEVSRTEGRQGFHPGQLVDAHAVDPVVFLQEFSLGLVQGSPPGVVPDDPLRRAQRGDEGDETDPTAAGEGVLAIGRIFRSHTSVSCAVSQ